MIQITHHNTDSSHWQSRDGTGKSQDCGIDKAVHYTPAPYPVRTKYSFTLLVSAETSTAERPSLS